MDAEKKLNAIEEEMKLLKGQLKQSLASVRDYLLNMELPSSEFSTILAALGSEGQSTQQITIDGSIASAKSQGQGEATDTVEEVIEEEIPESEDHLPSDSHDILYQDEEAEDEFEQAEDLESEESNDETMDELDDLDEMDDKEKYHSRHAGKPKPSLEEDLMMGYEKSGVELQPSTPRVNLLANLINWIAKAKKEIGNENLSTFLEVYGVSGHLSPELKEAILQLAEINTEQPDETNRADIWSQSMLSLHGILTGGDAPLYPFKSTAFGTEDEDLEAEEETIEVDKQEPQPIKLKLVLPNGDGQSREFCVNLTPTIESNEK